MIEGSPGKLLHTLRALDHFPLSTEAWNMLGHFYYYEVTKNDSKKKIAPKQHLKCMKMPKKVLES